MAAVIFTNTRQFIAQFERKAAAMDEAARKTAQAAVLKVERDTKTNLARTSHRKGTPTPSQPGQPPAKVSGGLGRSVTSTPAERIGSGVYRARVGVARGSEAQAYAPAQERGSSRLPARPYMSPAWRLLVTSGAFVAIRAAAFSEALKR